MLVTDRATPRLSAHARERCEQMGISTKRAKRVVQDPVMTLPGGLGHPEFYQRVIGEDYEIMVVINPTVEPVEIVTVLWRTYDDYDRRNDGQGFPGRAPGFEAY